MRASDLISSRCRRARAHAVHAQTPAPVVVQAVPAANVAAATASARASRADVASTAALQLLNAMKAANDEILKKQEATLQQLDELQKAAEQIKIYTQARLDVAQAAGPSAITAQLRAAARFSSALPSGRASPC